jgi:outer membrane cobalamin receptor
MATLYRIPFHVRTQYEPIKNLFFSLNMNGEYTQMNSNDKSYPMQRAWATCLLEKKKLFKRLDILAYVNAEKNSLFAVPITYGADVLFDTDKDILLYAKYTKSYRVPTLNELYYFPGGNEQLKPERAESLEGGFSAEKKLGGLFLTNQFSAFSRKVNDWILWRGAAIFFPDNIAFVKSRGLENETKCRFNIGYTKQQSSLLYSYTLSTSEKSNFVGDSSLGKQIPYVPRYSVRFNHGVTWKNLFVQWQQAYVSYRFTTTDESQFLLPYHLSNLFAQYKWHLKKHAFSGQIHLNNLFNTNYESMRGRIMPRRNLAVGFIWSKV